MINSKNTIHLPYLHCVAVATSCLTAELRMKDCEGTSFLRGIAFYSLRRPVVNGKKKYVIRCY